jgi:hypothetical protein
MVIDHLTRFELINRSQSHGMAPGSSLSFSCTLYTTGFSLLAVRGSAAMCLIGLYVVLEIEIREAFTVIRCDLIHLKSARSARNFHVLNEVLLLSVSANLSSCLESQQVIVLASSYNLNVCCGKFLCLLKT